MTDLYSDGKQNECYCIFPSSQIPNIFNCMILLGTRKEERIVGFETEAGL